MTYKQLSEAFADKWELTPEKLDEIEKDYMTTIRSLLWRISMDVDDETNITESMASCYDADTVLKDIIDLINKFNNIFHIISITTQWQVDKHFDRNEEIKSEKGR